MYNRKTINDIGMLRQDIRRGTEIWKEILDPYVEYAYFKGSAAKTIETWIDYIPEVSDLDIHIKAKEGFLPEGPEGVRKALDLATRYENLFTRGEYWHMPRTQIIEIGKMENLEGYYTPLRRDVEVLIGDPKFPDTWEQIGLSLEDHRRIDRERAGENASILRDFSYSVLDRTSLDLWSGLRKLCWRISPSVNRLLSQTEDPFEVWGMNRTNVLVLLKERYPDIADNYGQYYRSSWDLYNSNFEDSEIYRKCLYLGYSIIHQVDTKLKKFM